jgi:hypothetical protein
MSNIPLQFSTLYDLTGTNGSYVVNGSEYIFTFNISNSITFTLSNDAEYTASVLIVGGGGSGGEKSSSGVTGGGGGGGGEVIYNTNIDIMQNVPYTVVIGNGGAAVGGAVSGGYISGNDGGVSSIMGYNANGGKGGGHAINDFYEGVGGNSGFGPGYTGKGGNGGNAPIAFCSFSGNFGALVNGIYYGGGGGGGSYKGQGDCGNAVDACGNCFGRGGYGGDGGGGNRDGLVPVACRTNPISASSSNDGTPNSGGGGAGQNGNTVINFSGAGGSGLVILYVTPINGCTWNPALANLTTIWSRASDDCVDLSGAVLPTGQPMTYDDLSEKRKAVIFQYKNNGAGFSKKQHYSRLARGIGRQRGQTFATQSETYTNPNTHNLVVDNSAVLICPGVTKNWALTNENDTPGPLRRITNYPTVPLTNYKVRRTYLAGGTKWPQYAWAPGMLGFPIGKAGHNK